MKKAEKFLFTSESVSEGHPDKVCDQVSDAILDACLTEDKHSRVACECFAGKGFLLVSGEITTHAKVDYEKVARDTIRKIGYTDPSLGFDADNAEIILRINTQSPDIALGTNDEVGGAGDQGMMFGYACDETPEMMPIALMVSHSIVKRLADLRRTDPWAMKHIKPDSKSQVTVEYVNGVPARFDTILVSTQHTDNTDMAELKDYIIRNVIVPSVKKYNLDNFLKESIDGEQTTILVNPTGRFVVGGPAGDTGLTGRKLIVDTYGGYGHHGGGAFSGKDPTKVDRSAAYAARYIAKNIVAAKLAKRCEIQLSYAIGVDKPVSININTFGTGIISEEELIKIIELTFDLRPAGIIKMLDLRRPIYSNTSVYGHFGRDEDLDIFTWERVDKVDALRAYINCK